MANKTKEFFEMLMEKLAATDTDGRCHQQCDQIGRFIGLWATFQRLWQQLICPNRPTFLGNFRKDVKIFHFSSEINFGQLL